MSSSSSTAPTLSDNNSFEIEYGNETATVTVPKEFANIPSEILERAVEETRRICDKISRLGRSVNAQGNFTVQLRRQIQEIPLKEGYRDYAKVMKLFGVEPISEESFHKEQHILSNQTQQRRELLIIRARHILTHQWEKGSQVIPREGKGKIHTIRSVNQYCKISFNDAPHRFCDPCSYISKK